MIEHEQLSPDLIDYIIANEEDSLASDLIYYQKLDDSQHLRLLETNDYDLAKDRIEMYADEYTLPDSVIEVLITDEHYKTARSALVTHYLLSQKILRRVLEDETDYYELISIIETQALGEDLITYFLNEKMLQLLSDQDQPKKVWQGLVEYLISNQNLPDEFIHQIIEENELIYDLIHGQHLSNQWILRILSDPDLHNYYYELIRMQTFDSELAEYVFSMERNSPLFSLVRLQKLSKEHIERGLNSGYESIILGILEAQEFSEEEQDKLCQRYPQHEELIRSKTSIHSTFWSLFNKRNKRDGRLDRKRKNIF